MYIFNVLIDTINLFIVITPLLLIQSVACHPTPHLDAFIYPTRVAFDEKRTLSSNRLYQKRHDYKSYHHKLKLTEQSNHGDDTKHRASIHGVSISPIGFIILLQSTTLPGEQTIMIPIRVTTDPEDAFSASSPESLTLCQLLNGVDMAGAMLKPSILNEAVALSCALLENQTLSSSSSSSRIHVEDELGLSTKDNDIQSSYYTQSNTRAWVNQRIAETLPPQTSFATAHPWERNKVEFPSIQLIAVDIELPVKDKFSISHFNGDNNYTVPLKYNLECIVNQNQRLTVPLYSEVPMLKSLIHSYDETLESELVQSELILRQCLYTFDISSSAAYLAVSLALRYDVPISISSKVIAFFSRNVLQNKSKGTVAISWSTHGVDEDDTISTMFPQWKSRSSVRTMTARTLKDIEKGFELKKLISALNVAKTKKDRLAAAKIELEISRLRDASRITDPLKDGNYDGDVLG